MNIIYLSSACTETKFKELFEHSEHKPGQAVMKYHRLIMEGLAKNGASVTAISSLPVNRVNCAKKRLVKCSESYKGIEYVYPTVYNVRLFKNVFLLIQIVLLVLKEIKKHRNEKNVIICDGLYITLSMAAIITSKLRKVSTLGIVTDVPGKMVGGKKAGAVADRVIRSFDSYILLTEQMNEIVNPNGKPYIVQEGLVDSDSEMLENSIKNKFEKFTFLYTGLLQREYGVEMLVKSFVKAGIPEAELLLCGDGPYKEELITLAESNPSVRYCGNLLVNEVVRYQTKADVLINPRFTNEEFTKYSFPSKNMEYMASGTATMTTKLAGMPEKYIPYVLLIEDETVDGLKERMVDVYNMGREQLYNMGKKSKRFVLDNKNNVVQAGKILEFIDEI